MYGPSHPVSIDQHIQKYRINENETYVEVCDRNSRELADSEEHRRDIRMTQLHQNFMYAGRVTRAVGAPMKICAHNCLAGSTLVPTTDGLQQIKDIKHATIIDGKGATVACMAQYFGVSQVSELTLNRYRSKMVVKATSDHRWFTSEGTEVTTEDLRPGTKLLSVTPRKQTSSPEYQEGLVHGIIYGDGTNSHGIAAIRVCSDHKFFSPVLKEYGFRESFPASAGGDPYYSFSGKGKEWKTLPVSTNYDYLLGFIRGWFAADGCVSEQPEIILTADKPGGDWLKQFGPVVGWFVNGEQLLTDETTNLGKRTRDTFNFKISRDGLTPDDILIPRKRVRFTSSKQEFWTVNGKEPAGLEDVYCFSVPTTSSFMLNKGLLTGNCFVSGDIADDSIDIQDKLKEAFMTMRMGGGIGYNFGTLRPRMSIIASLKSTASGAVSFMEIYNSNCKTVRSAGGRRGAQMGVLPIWHPDVVEFIEVKTVALAEDMQKATMLMAMFEAEKRAEFERVCMSGIEEAIDASKDRLEYFEELKPFMIDMVEKVSIQNRLNAFNLSIAITDDFMVAVEEDGQWDLVFNGKVYQTVDARWLWDKVMRATWDWAEPGVLFIDQINEMNNLYYCETISATNPCGEQPLPPYGACLLGSWNMVKYIVTLPDGSRHLDLEALKTDIPGMVRALDNVIDVAKYPLPQQEKEAKDKRRMGMGVTGMANAIEALGAPYGTDEYLEYQELILRTIANETYRASAFLAKEKGAFPMWDAEKYMAGKFVNSGVLDDDVLELMWEWGLRNSHLLSIAPTGTISLTADNISSGIEPVFAYMSGRDIINQDGVTKQYVEIPDYGVSVFGVKGVRADDLHVLDHVKVLCHAQRFVDSSIAKTCNVPGDVSFEDFMDVYMAAWKGGAKGCTTFRLDGKRFGMMRSLDEAVNEVEPVSLVDAADVCGYDPSTGKATGPCADD
jgi:ribonucleoside-diphosphate reductase alpha chain